MQGEMFLPAFVFANGKMAAYPKIERWPAIEWALPHGTRILRHRLGTEAKKRMVGRAC